MNEDYHGTGWQSASRLRNAVVPPRGIEHGLERRAGGLLIEERHAVSVTNHTGQFVIVIPLLPFGEQNPRLFEFSRLLRSLAVRQARLDYERIAPINSRRPGYGSVEFSFDLLVQAMEDRPFSDGRDAVAGRRHNF